jgi:hypothetical protein
LIFFQEQIDCQGDNFRKGDGACRMPMVSVRRLVYLAVLWPLIFAAGIAILHAQDGSVVNREYAIKAAYLYQFGHYIQWPTDSFADEQSPFVIGVLGDDPFGGALDEIARDKKINDRRIVIKRFSSPANYSPCHLLFVVSSADVTEKLGAIRKAQRFPVLLVGESPGFAEHGGTINLFIEQNKVRFEVNMEVAKQQQLKISSKLLSLAKIIGAP